MCDMTKAQLFQAIPSTVGYLWMALSESRLSMDRALPPARGIHGLSLKHSIFF